MRHETYDMFLRFFNRKLHGLAVTGLLFGPLQVGYAQNLAPSAPSTPSLLPTTTANLVLQEIQITDMFRLDPMKEQHVFVASLNDAFRDITQETQARVLLILHSRGKAVDMIFDDVKYVTILVDHPSKEKAVEIVGKIKDKLYRDFDEKGNDVSTKKPRMRNMWNSVTEVKVSDVPFPPVLKSPNASFIQSALNPEKGRPTHIIFFQGTGISTPPGSPFPPNSHHYYKVQQ